jgi:hypothetical protein
LSFSPLVIIDRIILIVFNVVSLYLEVLILEDAMAIFRQSCYILTADYFIFYWKLWPYGTGAVGTT